VHECACVRLCVAGERKCRPCCSCFALHCSSPIPQRFAEDSEFMPEVLARVRASAFASNSTTTAPAPCGHNIVCRRTLTQLKCARGSGVSTGSGSQRPAGAASHVMLRVLPLQIMLLLLLLLLLLPPQPLAPCAVSSLPFQQKSHACCATHRQIRQGRRWDGGNCGRCHQQAEPV